MLYDEHGAIMYEYALMVVLIAIAMIALVIFVGDEVKELFQPIVDYLYPVQVEV